MLSTSGPIQTVGRGGHRNLGRGGESIMNNQQGEGAGGVCPLVREARKLLGVPHLCTR